MNHIENRFEQRKFFYDPADESKTTVPTMPLLVVLDNGMMGEARSIRGAAAIVIGNEFLDAEDEEIDWLHRVESGRKLAMYMLKDDIDAVVYDKRKGIINDNFAVEENHPDYQLDSEPEKIRVENDRLLLLSLLKIGAIRIMEREDSYFLRPHPSWDNLTKDKCCGTCWHRQEREDIGVQCSVYDEHKALDAGKECGSYMPDFGQYKEYKGGTYIDLSIEYNPADLLEYFEDK